MRFETTYVIVAGIAWIRRSRVETCDGRVEESVWLVTFDGEHSDAHKEPAGDSTINSGRVAGIEWSLGWVELAPQFETPHRLLRRVAPTQLVTKPALAISGHIGDRVLDRAPGHTARLWGRRHARSWGWAHASEPDGRWAHLLTASAPPLPRVSQYATNEGGPGLPIARGNVHAPRVTVGPYTVDAPEGTFIGLRYLDTDGSDLWCYHSEQGRLRGRDIDFSGAAMEIATREPIPGWRVAT